MISPLFILSLIICYFLILLIISFLPAEKMTIILFSQQIKFPMVYSCFWNGWSITVRGNFYLCPRMVGTSGFTYFQVVLGILLDLFFRGIYITPIYYNYKLTSIYELKIRFGKNSHLVGASSFFISRVLELASGYF